MSGVVLFDCTRLIERRKAVTPTGIDRVDIHYLNHLFKKYPDNIVGVVQYGQRLVAMKHEHLSLLRDTLALRWISDNKIKVPDSVELDVAYAKGKELAKTLESHIKEDLIHPNILDFLVKKKSQKNIYVNASHLGLDKEALMLSIKQHLNCKMLFFIHDIIPIDYPEYVAANGDIIHKKRINNVSLVADRVIVNSRYTRDRVESYLSKCGYRVPDIDILYIGADTHFKDIVSCDANILDGKKYFVSVGTIEPRKNHIMLFNIWRRWIEERDDAPYLVLIGKRGWEIKTVTNMLDLSPALRSRVVELSGLSDQDMVSILKGSQGLLFPTFVEGWGMPLAESLSLGVGAVCSDIDVFKECGQNLATYIDPLDAKSWYDELVKINLSKDIQNEMRAKAAQYVSPDWADHYSQLSVIVDDIFNTTTVVLPNVRNTTLVKRERTESERLQSWVDLVERKEQLLINTVPEVYKPNGKTFEDRYNLLGHVRCLRLAAEAYVQEGRIDDAIRVLKIAQTKEPKTKNIKYRILVLKYPFFEKLLGNRRFEPYYYGKHEVSA